jgi:hypothetical protein
MRATIPAVLLLFFALAAYPKQTPAQQSDSTKTDQADQTSTATKRKADALMEFLEKTKDKRVEKTVLSKYKWTGVSTEEFLNYNVKIGDAKYTVVRPGKDVAGERYIVFIVKPGKATPSLIVADDDVDGLVDRGQFQDKKASSEQNRQFAAKKGLGAEHRVFWQGEYVKAVEALCQYLGVSIVEPPKGL